MTLQAALDRDVSVAVDRFLSRGTPATVPDLYSALQRSNSSLRRMQKRALTSSLERVLATLEVEEDEEADAEAEFSASIPDTNAMNRSLRANLAPEESSTLLQKTATGEETTYGTKRKPNGESFTKRRKTEKLSLDPPTSPNIEDIGGMDDVILQLELLVGRPMLFPHKFTRSKLSMPRGVLIYGPPGCGKTFLCRAMAATLQKPFIQIQGPSLVSGMSGESEKGIRDMFDTARQNAPCLIFIDEIDAIAPKRESSQSQMEKRMVTQLLVSIDELSNDPEKPVMVLAATNRPDSIDQALRRGGRFGAEIHVPNPNERAREMILKAQSRNLSIAPDVDFVRLAQLTSGFVGADLQELLTMAGADRLNEEFEACKQQVADGTAIGVPADINAQRQEGFAAKSLKQLVARSGRSDLSDPVEFEEFAIKMANFCTALPRIKPTLTREGFTTRPSVTWKDVGALTNVRKALTQSIILPIKSPKLYEALGLEKSSGVLLWGPPGCGKTLIAKAAAGESGANFIGIKGPELLGKYVGDSESAIRSVFARARCAAPCVVFFDEFDALAPRRDAAGNETTARVVNMLLAEFDGQDSRAGVYIIAATNRPDMIDPAMLRPGRLDPLIYVDLPRPEERAEILRALVGAPPSDFDPEIATIARNCDDFSGADLKKLKVQAALAALEAGDTVVTAAHYKAALDDGMTGSVKDIKSYRRLAEVYSRK